MKSLDLNAEYIDTRDIIERIKVLRDEIDALVEIEPQGSSIEMEELRGELAELEAIMADMAGKGGDEEWEGVWYPVTLIRESYFEEYAQELAEDCGAIDRNAKWPLGHIDWKAAAEELKVDYTCTEINGNDYWYQ